MTRRIVYRPMARDDLRDIFLRRRDYDGPLAAFELVSSIEQRCETLAEFADRGTPRPEIAPGLRSIPYKRHAVIAYLVEEEQVVIVGIMYGGRDLTALSRPGRTT